MDASMVMLNYSFEFILYEFDSIGKIEGGLYVQMKSN